MTNPFCSSRTLPPDGKEIEKARHLYKMLDIPRPPSVESNIAACHFQLHGVREINVANESESR